jgi:hypothetical protein
MMMWRKPTGSGAFLDGLFGVAPRDRRDTTVGFATLFLAMAGHAMMEAARDTLFLQGLPATRLPWAYLAIAVATLAGSAIQRRFLVGVSRRGALRWTLLAGAAGSAVFALAPSLHASQAALLGFYTGTGLLATTIVVQFWLLAGAVMDFGQAKRAFALLGAGGLLGALFGSIGAAGVLLIATAQALPLVASAIFAAASFVPRYFSPERAPTPPRADFAPVQGEVSGRDRYLYRVFALVLLGTVTVTLVDYLFKSTVAHEVPRERLGEFFSRYYAVINAAALTLELFVTPRLLRAFGVHRLVLVMPALLLGASLGFAAGGTLFAVLLLRGTDGSLRHSVNRVGVELLHLPLDGDLRAKMRTLSEAGGLRAGQALASLFVLTALGLGVGDSLLPWAPVVLSAVWLAATLRLEGAYLDRLRYQVERRSTAKPTSAMELDPVSQETLTRIDRATLQSAALRTVERAVVTTCWRRAVEIARAYVPTADDALAERLSKALTEETGRALERTFRVMHILEPGHAFQVIFAATRSDDPDVRARGREMIEHLAPPTLRRALLALLDEAPVSTRLLRPLGFRLPGECLQALRLSRPYGTSSLAFQRAALVTLEACLTAAAVDPNPSLRTLAVRYAATLERRQQEATLSG